MTQQFRTFAQQKALEQESRRQWLIELAADCQSGTEVARRAGIERSNMYSMAKSLGVELPNATNKCNSQRKYRDCAEQGLTVAQTAKHLGVGESAVRRMARVHGITFRDARKIKRAKPKPSAKAKPSKPVSVPQENPIDVMKRMAAAESAAMRRVGSR